MLKPIFPGTSDIDQLNKIAYVLGTPDRIEWQEGYKLAAVKGYSFPNYQGIGL